MTVLQQIEQIKKVRGLRRNPDGVFEVDLDIEVLLRAFRVMREIAILRGREAAEFKDERGDVPYDAGVDQEFEKRMSTPE